MKRISSGGIYEKRFGYSRAVVAGGFIHVSGTTAQGENVPDDIETQADMAISAIQQVLENEGSSLKDAVRVVYYLTDANDFEQLEPVLSKHFGEHPPAATMLECKLISPLYKIEIELTALAPNS